MVEAFADVSGIKLCYKSHGEGFPTFLLHGFGSKKEGFMAQIPELSKHFRVINFDMRGAGKSSRPNYHYTMDILADDIKGLMDYLSIKKINIVAHSFGGMIAQNFILKYPESVNKLVLINTLPKIPDGYDPEPYIQMRIKGLELRKQDPVKAFWDSTQFGFHHIFRKRMLDNPKEKFYGLWSAEDLIEYYTSDPPTPQDIRNISYSFKTHNTFDNLHKIQQRTLLLTASHDVLVPKERMIEIHNLIPNSTLKVIENAGHESHKSNAPEVNEIIINFLEN
ncbi:MAG: alpha/beta fold hydrolase [Promethearchaeota archaeon]|jgi:pimeloyl-ACP methyl ester carboxylesterase